MLVLKANIGFPTLWISGTFNEFPRVRRIQALGSMTPVSALVTITGGPAVRIRGQLDGNGEPKDAHIEYQDWFTPC